MLAKETFSSTIFVEIEFSKLDTSRLVDFRFTEENFESFFSGKGIGEYSVKILDKSKNTLYSEIFGGVDFTMIIDTETGVLTKELNYTTKGFRLLLPDNSYFINFYKNDKELLSIRLSDHLCNNNHKCETDGGESEYLCPQDCGIRTTTTIPITTTTIPTVKPGTSIYVYLVVIIIIIAVISFLLFKIRRIT